MEDSTKSGKPVKSATSTDQTQQADTTEHGAQPTPSGKGVFIMKAKGQSFEEFKEAVIKQFRDAGMIKD